MRVGEGKENSIWEDQQGLLFQERAFLVAVDTGANAGWTAEESLQELAALVRASGDEVIGSLVQRRELPHPQYYVGRGKAEELKAAKGALGFTMLVADDELSARQQRCLEELLKVKVVDRSSVILDIFAQRARTHEGRIQVELAQLEYQLPRLRRMWSHLSRLGGGTGGARRGPGETQLEVDRRVIRERIKRIRERVEEVRQRRETAARARQRGLLPAVAIVGYTNAGKSTLLNALVGEEVVVAQDMLFATLDPTVRRVRLRDGQTIIASDTVGFIHKLPHQLIDAFHATLEEVARADVIIEVVDVSDRHAGEHRVTVRKVLDELGAGHKPRIVALNKVDLITEPLGSVRSRVLNRDDQHVVAISALSGEGVERLKDVLAAVLAELWPQVDMVVPYSAGELLSRLRERGAVQFEYRETDVRVVGRVPPSVLGDLRRALRR
ncbi:MAG: GTPase HflX [Thermoleophilia bacterium]|nr:GTPase HflX [Thermoleophilia bacterium]